MTTPTRTVELQINGDWINVSGWLDVGPNGGPLTITRGRDNESDDPNPGTCSFSLINDDGRFSLELPTGAYYPHFKQWIPVRVTVAGSQRFTGFVSDVETTIDDEAGRCSHSRIDCTDLLGVMQMSPAITSWAYQMIGDLAPQYWWQMSDPEGSEVAQPVDVSGFVGVPNVPNFPLTATVVNPGSDSENPALLGDVVRFGVEAPASLESDTQAQLARTDSGGSGKLFSTDTISPISAGAGFTLLAIVTRSTAAGGRIAITRAPVGGGTANVLTLNVGSQIRASEWISESVSDASVSRPGAAVGVPQLVAMTVSATTLGILGGGTVARPTTRPNYTDARIEITGDGLTVSNVAIVPAIMSTATYDDLRTKLMGAGIGAVTAWLTRASNAAGIYTTIATLGGSRSTRRPTMKGSNPGEVGAHLAGAANGMFAASRAGVPTWIDHMYAPGKVSVPAADVDPDLVWKPDDALYYTEVQVDGVTQAAVDDGFPKRAKDVTGLLPAAQLTQYVQWLVGTADVWGGPRLAQLTIDLLTLPSVAAYLALDLKSRVMLTSPPQQIPASRVMTVEGTTETVSDTAWTLTLNTAPDPDFVLDDDVAGLLNSGFRLAF